MYAMNSAMKSFIYILQLCLLIILVGCTRTKIRIIEEAEETIEISLQEIRLSQELLMPAKMFMYGDDLIVYHCEGDTLFSIFGNPISGEYINAGIKGRGPNEFMNVDIRSIIGSDEGFVCMDAGGLKKEVAIDNNVLTVRSSSKIDTQMHPQNGIFVDGGYLSMNVVNDASEFILYRYDGKAPDYLSDYPGWTADNEEMKAFTYLKHVVRHPTENKTVSLYAKFRKLRILDVNKGNTIEIDVRIPDNFRRYIPYDKENHIAYGSYPCVSEDNIYALCFNSPFDSDILPEIHVFDWEGNLEKRILLDTYIDIFVIDAANDILYGINTNHADTLYYQYLGN